MTEKLKLYRVKDHYLNYLRKFEPKIPINKDNGKKQTLCWHCTAN